MVAPLRTKVLAALMDSGSWVSRVELDTLSTCVMAVDDVMADLVVEQLAEHRPNVGYRLAAGPAARRAAQLLHRSGRKTAAAGRPGKDFYSIGVAETLPDLGLVLYELQMPNLPGPQALTRQREQAQAVIDFIHSRGGDHA